MLCLLLPPDVVELVSASYVVFFIFIIKHFNYNIVNRSHWDTNLGRFPFHVLFSFEGELTY